MHQQKKYFLINSIMFILSSFSSIFTIDKKEINFEEYLKKINNLSSITEIDNEITTIKDGIYQELITELSHITKKPYDTLKKSTDSKRNRIKKTLQKKPYFFIRRHDTKIPLSIYNDLHKSMLDENIHPDNITINYLPNINHSRSADATDLLRHINIYHKLSEDSPNLQLFIHKHEIHHILLKHLSSLLTASFYTNDLKNLISIKEREADIHAASKNLDLAHTGMQHRCTLGHLNITNDQHHCEEMTIMYELMKRKSELSKNQQV
jgi:hypothetical protein